MSQTVSLDDLKRELTSALAASEERITKKIHDVAEPHFTAIQTDLGKITDRLDAIEKLLWQGQRLDEHERRIIKLAETVGRPDLATPVTRPIGS